MSNYKNILVAVDINADYQSVIKKAVAISKSTNNLSLIHVLMPTAYIQPYLAGMEYNISNDNDRIASAKETLEDIAEKFAIPKENVFLKMGYAADEIKATAKSTGTDLIVIGTHGRSGLKLLLGSTANAVLHGVKQDVLAVRVDDSKEAAS